jgi:2-haloacid dehalogenase
MKKYKILIFDLDDTLIDNRENTRVAFAKMLAAGGGGTYSNKKFERWYNIDAEFWIKWQDGQVKIPPEFAHEVGKKSKKFLSWIRSQRILQYFGNAVSDERAVELNDIYTDALAENVVEIEGAREILKYLATGKNSYKIIIATNGPSLVVRHKLDKIGILPYVTEVLAADMFGCMKPAIPFFDVIEKSYNDFERADYLMIGDSLKSDVGFAQNVGIDSCWFDRGGEKLTAGYAPTFIVEDLWGLRAIL